MCETEHWDLLSSRRFLSFWERNWGESVKNLGPAFSGLLTLLSQVLCGRGAAPALRVPCSGPASCWEVPKALFLGMSMDLVSEPLPLPCRDVFVAGNAGAGCVRVMLGGFTEECAEFLGRAWVVSGRRFCPVQK